jgi:hypothetical protein
MEVIRDSMWERCLADAAKMYRLSEANNACYNLADATWKMKMRYKQAEQKKNERQIIVIDKAPTLINEQRKNTNICSATTMAGKRCSFKAVCGDFCKKHRVDKGVLGKKVDISKIKIDD